MLLSAFRWCARCPSSLSTDLFCISSEVLSALNASRGVVALESTVITHGLPRPKNYELAVKLESIVRASNAVPATIAILDGKVHIGLSNDQLKRVAEDVESVKVSRRDIPYVVANKLVGGTTVAATMYLANKAGIRVFATGGLGGVHRGASESFDVSADLVELAQTPVTVVCAGVKSILDIPKTLEYLETNSVNVIVYGRTNKFPGFFMAETESRAPYCTYSLNSIVDIMNCSKAIGLKAGCVVACPIPAEHETHGKVIEEAMRKALLESKELDIKSKNVTPFLLKRINELTKGASVRTNIALLENNVLIGAKLANLFAEKERFEDKRKKEGEIFGTANVSKKVSIGKKPPSVV